MCTNRKYYENVTNKQITNKICLQNTENVSKKNGTDEQTNTK